MVMHVQLSKLRGKLLSGSRLAGSRVVSRGQTSIFYTGRYTASDNALYKK